jgi:hypothetical protein
MNRRARFDRPPCAMNSPLLFTVVVALLTTGAATLWAVLVAADMTGVREADPAERTDGRTW